MSSAAKIAPSLKLRMLRVEDQPFYKQADINHSCLNEESNHSSRNKNSLELRFDQLRGLLALENKEGYKCYDYLSFYSPSPDESGRRRLSEFSDSKTRESRDGQKNKIDEHCRTAICEWMYRVLDYFGVDREAASIALSYTDRILSTNHCADRKTFKLITSASLHLAIKVHYPHKWRDVGTLLPELSQGDFTMDDILAMEKELVHSLTWLLHPPTPQSIALYILSMLPPFGSTSEAEKVTRIALFLIELSVCDFYFVNNRMSIIAIAAVLNATETLGAYFTTLHKGPRLHVEHLLLYLDYPVDWVAVSSARDRLWELYNRSDEAALHCIVSSRNPSVSKSIGYTNQLSPKSVIQQTPSPTSSFSPDDEDTSTPAHYPAASHPHQSRIHNDAASAPAKISYGK